MGSLGIFSPVAVVKLMEGRANDDELICWGEGELKRACCWATKASRMRAASVRALGEPPNSDVILLFFANDARRTGSRFSIEESRGEETGVGDANGLKLRAGMAARVIVVVAVVVVLCMARRDY